MSRKLSYTLVLNIVDAANVITNQAKVDQSVAILDEVIDDQVFKIPAGQVDFQVPVVGEPRADFVFIVPDGPIVVKVGSTGSTPQPADALWCNDGSSITALYVSNPDSKNAVKFRVIQGVTE